MRTEAEKELKDRRKEVQRQERRIQQKEETLDRKIENFEKKEEALQKKISRPTSGWPRRKRLKKSQFEMLERISGFTVEQAKEYLLQNLEDELTHEKAVRKSWSLNSRSRTMQRSGARRSSPWPSSAVPPTM